MSLASGSIDLKSLSVAGAPNKYITKITGDGIKVHDSQNQNRNFLQITSEGITLYKGGNNSNNIIATFGTDITIGKANNGGSYINITDSAIKFFDGTAMSGCINLKNSSDIIPYRQIINNQNQIHFDPDDEAYIHLDYIPNSDFDVVLMINNQAFTYSIAIDGTPSSRTSPTYHTIRLHYNSNYNSLVIYNDQGIIERYFQATDTTQIDYQIERNFPSFSFGFGNQSTGNTSFSEGCNTQALGDYSHASGINTIAIGEGQFVTGKYNEEDSDAMFIIGNGTDFDHRSNLMVVGDDYVRIGNSDGGHTIIDEDGMKIYGGDGTTQLANVGYGEGKAQSGTAVAPYYTFGTRTNNSIIGNYSVAEGGSTTASNFASHAEGAGTVASGHYSHAEGINTEASYYGTHAEGSTSLASGRNAHAQNEGTIAQGCNQTAIGKYNIGQGSSDSIASSDYAFIIGNGTGDAVSQRSNALTVDWNGNITVQNHTSSIGTIKNAYNTTDISVSNNTAKSLCSFTLDPGVWIIEAGFRSSSNATGYRRGGCSTQENQADMNVQIPAVSGQNTQARWTISVSITTATTYYLTVYQNSSSTLTYPATGAGYGNFMRAIRIL